MLIYLSIQSAPQYFYANSLSFRVEHLAQGRFNIEPSTFWSADDLDCLRSHSCLFFVFIKCLNTQPTLSKEVQRMTSLSAFPSSPSLSGSQVAFSSDRERTSQLLLTCHDMIKKPEAEGCMWRSVNNNQAWWQWELLRRLFPSLFSLPFSRWHCGTQPRNNTTLCFNFCCWF